MEDFTFVLAGTGFAPLPEEVQCSFSGDETSDSTTVTAIRTRVQGTLGQTQVTYTISAEDAAELLDRFGPEEIREICEQQAREQVSDPAALR